MKDETYRKAANILRIHPAILKAVIEHAKEIDRQFADNGESPEDNIYAVKIIVQDKDENWYVSQDEPMNDKLWADARGDERDFYDDDDDEDEDDDDGDGGVEVEKPDPVLT